MTSDTYDYLDGNAAAGELSKIFVMDVTAAEGQCAHCGATKRFAEAHLYMQCPGVVARCAVCERRPVQTPTIDTPRLLNAGSRQMLSCSLTSSRAAERIADLVRAISPSRRPKR